MRFALAGLLSLALVGTVTAYASRRVGTDRAIVEAKNVTWVSMKGIVEPVLDDRLLDMDRDVLDRIDSVVRESVLRGSLIRVKIWAGDGTILYADEPRLIGERFELDADKLSVLAGGEGKADVSDLAEPENRYETENAKLLEVYQRTELPNGTPVLFETYFRYSGVTAVGRQLWREFAPIAIGALALLELIQIPLAWSMARRLRSSQQERERLLGHAIDASDAERRRIASDLHDGVVQDLTGVSLGLAALGKTEQITAEQVVRASSSIRTSIKSLRSLLVEIYPPNLQEEGLESAIGDLLGRLAARGMATRLDVDLDDLALDLETSSLLYRSAQEALRNVATHSGAQRVRVEIRADGGWLHLVVDDDGKGFSDEVLADRVAHGHVGLRSLAGLVADLGGKLTVRSAPGTGTRVEVQMPAPTKTLTREQVSP
ncbi:MAG TPA: sensor histidine kinase [Ilumatobacteraceae bacterium]|nr:sensor histidine kinase [Ilumatobacteraceae bacterium]